MENQIKTPEARYAYYRRCQATRRNGAQCKAPAERGSEICHMHAAQRATQARLEAERCLVFEKAAVEVARRGANGIQATIAAITQALLDDTISSKTAGRMLMDVQQIVKLL